MIARGGPGRSLPAHVGTAVIGGGIAGASACYHLAHAGEDVILLERGSVGGGATSAAVGVLSPPIRQPFHETVRFLGEEPARRLWEFAQRSVDGLETVLTEHGTTAEAELDLSGGYVIAEPHSLHEVEDAYEALQKAGIPIEWLDVEALRELCPRGKGFSGAMRLPRGGAIAPGPTAVALARAAASQGAVVYEQVDVAELRRDDGSFELSTSFGALRADRVVHATHVDVRRFSPFMDREVVPIRGQGFRTAPMEHRFDGAFATHWKLNVWRQDAEGRLLVSGWRHDAWSRAYGKDSPELDPTLQTNLFEWFESAFPDLAPLDVQHKWSGVFGWTADFLPLVGSAPGRENEYVTSGFSGGGLPFAFESGRILATLICDRTPPDGHDLFDPRRFGR